MINEAMKWPSDKKRYDQNYLRVFGEKCPHCHGVGRIDFFGIDTECVICHGVGYVERRRDQSASQKA